MEQEFKYFAFISYNSKDTEWGKRLQKKLEGYKMPSTLCSERGWDRKPIKPVFFAPSDIQPGGLTAELQERLKASRNLIVICSPNSAQSEWVGKEIEFFHSLGRTKHIHFFIVNGIPNSGNPNTECFNPVVKKLGLPEILGANIHEKIYRWPWLNKERAYVQTISKLLEVEFDSIWQRHKRQLIQKTIAWIIGVIIVLAAVIGAWNRNLPIDTEIRLVEATPHNPKLPPLKDAIVSITLENEMKQGTIKSMDRGIIFTNIPKRFLGREVKISVTCKDFLPIDTTLTLNEKMTIDIRRDENIYGDIHFTLWNIDKEAPMPNTTISVKGIKTVSDSKGRVKMFIPIESQDTVYNLRSSIKLADEFLYVPHTEDAIVIVQ